MSGILKEWFEEKKNDYESYLFLKKNTEFYHQYQEAEKYNKTLPDEIRYPTYQSLEKV
jgi:hypothetical protein